MIKKIKPYAIITVFALMIAGLGKIQVKPSLSEILKPSRYDKLILIDEFYA
jgi:hypothetical protein